jgi:ArsR family transcriptional regulator, arsenate/arsenite/antimonite-responsive transcriptional repressor
MVKRVTASQASLNSCPAEECMQMLRALSDETRQKILSLFFVNKELCVNDIAKNFTLSRPTISHHLNLMKRAKLLNTRKEGKEIYYSFNRIYVVKLMESILDNLKKCC